MTRKPLIALAIWTVVICTANLTAAQVVAKGKLLNRTEVIPTRTIFTPTATGLYRLSIYGTITVADSNSTSEWGYTLSWTDDSGVTNVAFPIYASGRQAGSFANFIGSWGAAVPIEVKAGAPITFAITQSGSGDKSAYSPYWTLERLE